MASLSMSLPQDDSGHRVAFKHSGKVILTPHPSPLEDTLFIHAHEDSLGARVWCICKSRNGKSGMSPHHYLMTPGPSEQTKGEPDRQIISTTLLPTPNGKAPLKSGLLKLLQITLSVTEA